jgi:hypothetical protein
VNRPDVAVCGPGPQASNAYRAFQGTAKKFVRRRLGGAERINPTATCYLLHRAKGGSAPVARPYHLFSKDRCKEEGEKTVMVDTITGKYGIEGL